MDTERVATLVQRALAREPPSVSELIARLTPVIQARVARSLLARRSSLAAGRVARQEVEDLCQEVFLLLFANGGHVLRSWQAERGSSLENFVGLVAERQVLSFLRSGKRNPWNEEPGEAVGAGARAEQPNPEEVVTSRQQLDLLLERLRRVVSPLGWTIFELLFVRELSLPEVIAASGLSADAIYAWRSRLRKLAHRLQAELSGNPRAERTTKEEGGYE